MAVIAQITDLHLRDDGADPFHDPAQALRRAFAQIAAMDRKPEAIVLTGDIIDRSAKGYGHVLPLLRAAPVPLLPMPGNQDDATAFRAAFADWADFHPDHLSFTRQIGDVFLITLESTRPDGGAGLAAHQLDWLAQVFAKATGPAILALHHPPFPTAAPHLDRAGFQNADALAALVTQSPVRRIIAGHSHRAMQTVWAGRLASTAPAIGHGLSLSLTGAAPHKPVAALPAFELHILDDSGMVSHLIPLDGMRSGCEWIDNP